MDNACPCGSGADYLNCCAPLHQLKRQAETAEILMRSRYSAYVLQDAKYLLHSWHPQTRPTGAFGWDTDWLGLEILQTRQGGENDKRGYVEFIARYRAANTTGQLHEISRFQRYEGRWVYLDGELNPSKQPPGRNAPCPCGSGKKHKLCCAK